MLELFDGRPRSNEMGPRIMHKLRSIAERKLEVTNALKAEKNNVLHVSI